MKSNTFLIALVFAALLTACGKPTPAPLPPQEIIGRAAERMKNLAGFHFIIDHSGTPDYLDTSNTLAFSRIEGDFTAPDRAYGKVRVTAAGLVAQVEIICIGDQYYQTNLLTGKWEKYPANSGFNPATLFDPAIGLQAILESDLTGLSLEGTQELDELPGKALYSISGKMAGKTLYQLSYQLIGPDDVTVQLWIMPETFEIYRIELVEPGKDGQEASIWKVDFLNFDQKVDIQPPSE